MRYVPPAFPIANISIANTHYDLVDRVQILIDLVNSRHVFKLDDISGQFNGAQTVFYMTENGHDIYASTAMNVLLDINGTRQEPRVAYNVYRNEITFTAPPLAGSTFHGVVQDVWAGAFSGNMPSDVAYARSAGSAGDSTTLNGKTESQLNVNSASFVTGTVLEANNALHLNGKTEGNLNVNSAVTANNVTNFGGQPASYYTNASNMSTGTLPAGRLSGLYANASVNNATYAFGKLEGQLDVNSAAYVTGTVLEANNATYLNGKTESQLNVNSALTANNSTYAFGKTEGNLNVNSALTANNSTYAFGKTEGNLNVNSALSANVANNATYAYGKTEENLNVNSALSANVANNSTYAYGKNEGNLNVNSALQANNAAYLGGRIASQYLWKYAGGSPANGQVLTYNSANASWYAANATGGGDTVGTHTLLQSNVHTDTTNGTVSRGALITGQGANATWQKLSLGTSGYVLTSNGTEAVWQAFTPTGAGTATQKLDDLSSYFNGSQTVFVTTVSGANVAASAVENLLIYLGGIAQEPNVAFTQSGNTITFAVAPPTGASFHGVLLGSALNANNANNADYLNGKPESNLNVNSAYYVVDPTPAFDRIGLGTANAHANAVAVMAGQYFSPLVDDGNSGTDITIDWNLGNEHKLTLTANATLDFANPLSGGRYVLLVFQDGTGGWSVTWPASVVWPAGTPPSLTAGMNKMDMITFLYDAGLATYFGAYSLNY